MINSIVTLIKYLVKSSSIIFTNSLLLKFLGSIKMKFIVDKTIKLKMTNSKLLRVLKANIIVKTINSIMKINL